MVRVLCVNIWPIASKTAIGYMSEHLFNNKDLFDIMEIYTNDVEVYTEISTKVLCKINPYRVQRTMALNNRTNTLPNKKTKNYFIELAKLLCKFFVPVKIDRNVLEEIKKFNPDVIYTQGYDIRILRVTNRISKLLNKKIIVHTLDDWFTTKDRLFNYLNRKALSTVLKNSISISASPSMTERLRDLFSCESTFVSNCASFVDEPDKSQSIDNSCSLLYVGNLTLSRYRSLVDLAAAINEVECLSAVKIHVYSPEEQISEYGDLFGENVVLHNSVEQKNVAELIKRAKIVLHIESFDDDYYDFIKYSLSTKIAEYASFGKPIIYYGPLDVGVARFLRENQVGETFNDATVAAIRIKELLLESYEYERVAETSWRNAKNFFDTDIVQNRIIESIKIENKS